MLMFLCVELLMSLCPYVFIRLCLCVYVCVLVFVLPFEKADRFLIIVLLFLLFHLLKGEKDVHLRYKI